MGPLRVSKEERGFNWTNYFGNDECAVALHDAATSIGDIQGFVSYTRQFHWPLCYTGSGLSSAPLCCSKSGGKTAIQSTAPLWGVNEINEKSMLVDVQAGARLSYVAKKLAEKGFELRHPPSFLEISAAGAVSTASHGSFPGGRSLSSHIAALDIVDLFGKMQHISNTSPQRHLFNATRAGLGTLGFVEIISFRISALTHLERRDYAIPFDDALGTQSKLNAIIAQHPHWIALQFSPLCDDVLVRTASPTSMPGDNSFLAKFFAKPWAKYHTRLAQPLLKLISTFSASSASQPQHNADIPTESTSQASQAFFSAATVMKLVCAITNAPVSFIAPSFEAVAIARPGNMGTYAEYYVDRQRAAAAVTSVRKALREAHDAGKINFNGFVSISFVAQEEAPTLAPNFRFDSAAIEITTFFQGLQLDVLKIVENALSAFAPLPHLGSVHSIPSADIKARYGPQRIKAFSDAVYEMDKEPVLLNKWKKDNYVNAPSGFGNVKI